MSAVDLLQPILEQGLERNNFFNGRLLSAEDLRAEQVASRTRDGQLGRAIGDGVAWGLEVSILAASGESPSVRVRKGVALNRNGDVLHLPDDADVTLVPAEQPVPEVAAGLFTACRPIRPTASLVGEGAYVLTVSPTSGYRDTALVSDPNTAAAGRGTCGARFTVEGVRFRLVPMSLSALDHVSDTLRDRAVALLPTSSDASRERVRNLLAHLCFGTGALDDYFSTPRPTTGGEAIRVRWGALDALRERCDITSCDVPLALCVTTDAGISFLDMWAARRTLADRAAIERWTPVAGPRRVAEAEAAFLQFQTQLEIVRGLGSATAVAASTYFDVLPAGGWLPGGSSGFSWATFLGPHAPPAATPVDAALLRGILERSWFDEPFRLDAPKPVPLHVYQVPDLPTAQQFVVYARSARGNIRVTLSRAPGASQQVEVTTTAKVGPIGRVQSAGRTIFPLTDLVPGVHTVSVTAPDYVTVAAQEATVVGGRTIDIGITLAPLPDGSITVDAVDETTDLRIPASDVTSIVASGSVTAPGVLDAGTWRIANLPAGLYTVTGAATGYQTAVRAAVGPTAPNTNVTVRLRFARAVPAPTQPPECVKVANIVKPALVNATLCLALKATEMSERYFYADTSRGKSRAKAKATRPSETESRDARGPFGLNNRKEQVDRRGTTYVSGGGVIIYTDPPRWTGMIVMQATAELPPWLIQWRDWLAHEIGDDDIKTSEPVVYVEKNYKVPRSASEIALKPPAYAVFGPVGIPVLIKPQDRTAKAQIPLQDSGMRWLSPDKLRALEEAQIIHLDDLSAGWKELLVDVLGDPLDIVAHMIDEAGDAVIEANENFGYYTNVTPADATKLRDGGFSDDVAIANGDAEVLGKLLGSEALARSMIYQAREIVPAGSWSLETLGVTDEQTEAFREVGVTSMGDFAASARKTAGRAMIAEVLGLTGQPMNEREKAITPLANEAASVMAKSSMAMAPIRAISTWKGTDATTATKLESAGFATVDEVAVAAPQDIATAGNITLAAAERLVEGAQRASTAALGVGTVSSITATEEKALNERFDGNATIGAVLAATPAELTSIFGSETRAAAVLGGMQAGMTGRMGMR